MCLLRETATSCKIDRHPVKERKLTEALLLPMQFSELISNFGAKSGRVLGVFVSSEAVFLVELEKLSEEGRFRVRQARTEKWRGMGAPWEDATTFSETLMRLAMTYNLSYGKISVCLPRDLFFVYEREFPAMERSELDAAARWDIETNVPYAEGKYWPGYGRYGNDETRLELAALSAEHGRELVEAMTATGLGVAGLTMAPLKFTFRREGTRIVWHDFKVELPGPILRETWTPEFSAALYASLRFYCPLTGIEFLPQEERPERVRLWRSAGNWLVACTLAVVAVCFVRNAWLLSAADARMDELRQEYALEMRARETMAGLANGAAEIGDAEKALRQLSKERRSWYAILSALGAVTVDGVYLTEFDVQEDGAMLCGGRATNHGRLVAYLERLGNEAALREKPTLKESAVDPRGELRFKLRLRF